jgi:hypothetical protein
MSLDGFCPTGPVMANSEEDVDSKLAELAELEPQHAHLTKAYNAVWMTTKDQEIQLSRLDTRYCVVCMLLLFTIVYIVCSGVYIVRTAVDEMVSELLFWSSVYIVICGVLLHIVCALMH